MKHKAKLTAIAGIALISGVMSTHEAYSDVVLKHRYTFDQAEGTTTVVDSVGGANGTLVINTTPTNTVNTGFTGTGALILGQGNDGLNAGNGDYVNFPNGIITGMDKGEGNTTFTFEIWWSKSDADIAWSRVWDFGNSSGGEDGSGSSDGQAQFVLAAENGASQQRFEFRRQGINGVWGITGPPEPAVDELTHSLVVWDEPNDTYSYYINGVLIGSNPLPWTITEGFYNADSSPADVNNWLGRSQWGDTLFQGKFEEFAIYESAVDVFEVAELYLGGPDNAEGAPLGELTDLDTSVTGNPDEVVIGESITYSVLAIFANFPPGINVSGLTTYSSSNENVATVNENGVITGVNPGTAIITADYEGTTDTLDVTVIIPERPEAVLAHRYTFDGTGTVLADSVDTTGASDGTLIGGATFNGDGTLSMDGTAGTYIDFPNGMISGLGADATFEAWITVSSSGGAWQRVWDFGNTNLGEDPVIGGDAYQSDGTVFYNPVRNNVTGGNGGRYEGIMGDGGSQFTIDPSNAFTPPLDEEYHVLATYNHAQRTATLWVDGQLAGTGNIGGDSPLSDLDDVNNWLGRSQWSGDAYFTGDFNEFRIYTGVPSELEIAISRSAGPNTLVDDPGALNSIAVNATQTTAVEGTAPVAASVVAQFATVPNVDISYVPGVVFTSSDPSVARIIPNPTRILPVGAGTTTLTAEYDGVTSAAVNFTVTAAPGGAPVLTHRFDFETGVNDVVGGKTASIVGVGDTSPTLENGGVTFAANGYVDIENFVFGDFWYLQDAGSLTPVTLEIFGTWSGAGNFSRLFDFGDTNFDPTENPPVGETYNGRTYAYLSPGGNGNLVFDFVADTTGTGTVGSVGRMEAAALPGAGAEFHVVVVIDIMNGVMRMYRNGQFAGVSPLNNTQEFRDALVGGVGINDVNVWLGRSNFGADPFFNGTITEFRMWSGAMQEAEAVNRFYCGPDDPNGVGCEPPPPTDVEIAAELSGGDVVYTWNSASTLQPQERSSLTTGAWGASSGTPVDNGDGTQSLTLPADQPEGYFQLAE